MEKIITNGIIEDVISSWLPITNEFQKCSFVLPNGKFIEMKEHYELYRALVLKQLVQCIPDAEQLVSDLGYLRYSYVGYLILPDSKLTKQQYKTLELVLLEISKYRDEISVQIQQDSRFYINYSLKDIPYVINKIKRYYSSEELLP